MEYVLEETDVIGPQCFVFDQCNVDDFDSAIKFDTTEEMIAHYTGYTDALNVDESTLFRHAPRANNTTMGSENNNNITVQAKSNLPSALTTINWCSYLTNNIIADDAPFHDKMELISDMLPRTGVDSDMDLLCGYHALVGAELDEDRARAILTLKKHINKLPSILALIKRFSNHPDILIRLIYHAYESSAIKSKCIPLYPISKIESAFIAKFRIVPGELIEAPLNDFYETEISYTVLNTEVGLVDYGHILDVDAVNNQIMSAIERAMLPIVTKDLPNGVMTTETNIPVIIGQDIKGRNSYFVNIIDQKTTEYIIPVLIGAKWATLTHTAIKPYGQDVESDTVEILKKQISNPPKTKKR